MWRGLSLRCKIAVFVAVFFLGVAGLCFFHVFMNRDYFRSQARFYCLMAIKVDFSVPGVYSASVNSKPHYLENAFLALDVPRRVLSKTDPRELISGLEGNFEVIDKDGRRIIWGSIIGDPDWGGDPNNIKSRYFKNLIELSHFASWYEFVQWQININITQGAQNLKDIPQRLILYDRNFNYMNQEDFCKLYGWASLIIAVIILIVVAALSLRKRKLIECDKKLTVATTSSPPISGKQV